MNGITEFDAWGSNLIGIAGVVLAFLFYRWGRRFKEPCWGSRGRIIVRAPSSELSDVRVSFRGKDVPVVSIDQVILWNTGAETISRTDIVRLDPLRVALDGDGEILDASMIATNNPYGAVTVTLAEDRRSVRIDFDYLDQDQGAVIQLLTTSTRRVCVKGSLKGARALRVVPNTLTREELFLPFPGSWSRRLSPKTRRIVNALTALALIVTGVTVLIQGEGRSVIGAVICPLGGSMAAMHWGPIAPGSLVGAYDGDHIEPRSSAPSAQPTDLAGEDQATPHDSPASPRM